MSNTSRLILDHPALGTAGGAGLHASITAIYKKIGDNISTRILPVVGLADTATATVEHDLKTAFGNYRYDLYLLSGSDPYDLTRVTSTSSPALSAFTIAATSGFATTKIDITNNSGASRDLALVIIMDPLRLDEGDIQDIDVVSTPPTNGQALVYDSGSGKWKPSSATLGQVSVADLTALAAIASGSRQQGEIVEIQSDHSLYVFDSASSATADAFYIVAPSSGSGRWYRVADPAVLPFVTTNTVSDADYTVLTSDGYSLIAITGVTTTRNITLPAASSSINRVISFEFQSGTAGKVTITRAGSDTIEGNTAITLWEALDTVTLKCVSSSRWEVINKKMVPKSEVKLSSGAGLGSSGTKIQYFTNVDYDTGRAWTYVNNSTDGAKFTIVQPGVYSISYGSRRAAGGTAFGISLNATPTTDSSSLTGANLLTYAEPTAAGQVFTTATTKRLAEGDIIRAHTDSNNSGTSDARTNFAIAQVEKFYV
jgi:hypothetical protein